ncbi:Ribonuclease toxin, BrnT, of type II toxin-antitoxin system [Rhizobiales bacterium GAS191]|nr:Ribonuclease toxin, BrnT, of type II toxin-antitoxin system [Rhizobiales bacterium GAS191]
MQIDFDWDPAKAKRNAAKHRATFEEAMTVFRDPHALSMLGHGPQYREGALDHLRGNNQWKSSLGCAQLAGDRGRSGRGADHIGETADEKRGAPISRGLMKDQYDFSKAERGRFHRPGATLVPPVHLDPEVLAFLAARAEARGVPLSELVNTLLKKDIELIEAAE